jgi:glutamine synthetase
VSPELPARKSNIDSHPEEQSVPDDTGSSLEVTQLTLQDEKLQPLNKALTQDSIEALIEAKLDDFDSLSATTDDWLNSVVGIKRTEIRKIRRVLEAQDAADAAL